MNQTNTTTQKKHIANQHFAKGMRRITPAQGKKIIQEMRSVWKAYVLSPSFPSQVCERCAALRMGQFDSHLQWLSREASSSGRPLYSWDNYSKEREGMARYVAESEMARDRQNKQSLL